NEGLQAFMDRFKFESSHIKGVPPVLLISAFRGEVVAGSAKLVRPSQEDKGYIRPSWYGGPKKARNRGGPRETRRNIGIYTPYPREDTPKEILAMESVSFPEPPPLIETLKKQNLNKFYDYHGDRSHNTYDCYQLKKQIEEVVASGKEGGNRKRPFEKERSGITDELTFPAIPQNQLTDEPIILEGVFEGNQVRRILVDGGISSSQDLEDAELR
ncbi:hypothetical protein Tco_1471446, partial [Tanacetum coccineum]